MINNMSANETHELGRRAANITYLLISIFVSVNFAIDLRDASVTNCMASCGKASSASLRYDTTVTGHFAAPHGRLPLVSR